MYYTFWEKFANFNEFYSGYEDTEQQNDIGGHTVSLIYCIYLSIYLSMPNVVLTFLSN